MSKQSAVSNEELVAALLASNTIAQAGEACGLAPRTIYDRMQTNDFRVLYTEAKAETVRGVVNRLNQQLLTAVDVIAEVMNNEDVNPATRLQAAQTILSSAAKLSEQLRVGEDHVDYACRNARISGSWGSD